MPWVQPSTVVACSSMWPKANSRSAAKITDSTAENTRTAWNSDMPIPG